MRRLIVVSSIVVLISISCNPTVSAEQTPTPAVEVQTQTQAAGRMETPSPAASPMAAFETPGPAEVLQGPDISYKGIHFALDPALGSRLYVLHETISIDGSSAHDTRFSSTQETPCLTWCVIVYPVGEFQQAFGDFVFPPSGYRGGAAVIFQAQRTTLAFEGGRGERALEAFGQSHYGVSNESLNYVFRGYSADKRYAVYVQVPVHAADLPDVAPTMTTRVDAIMEYNRQAAQTMEALAPTDFTPPLGPLDAMVASMRVDAP